MHFYECAAPTGSGKSYAAVSLASEAVKHTIKSVIVQPTIRLLKQTRQDAITRFPKVKGRIRMIASDRNSDTSVPARITDYLNNRDQTGDLLLLTHAGLLRTNYWHRRDTWHLYIDEALDITYFRKFRLKEHRHLLTGLFDVVAGDARYGELHAHDHGRLAAILAGLGDDEIHQHFADLVHRLGSPDWTLFVERDHFERFKKGSVHTLEVHGLLQPRSLDGFASVTLMSANLRDSLMYRYWLACGATFSENKKVNAGLQYQCHTNGHRLVIKYLSERAWSKSLRDAVVASPDGDTVTVGDMYRSLCTQEAQRHSPDRAPLWIGNVDVADEDFDGLRLPNNPLGLNDLTDYTVCAIMSALNPSPSHARFLAEACNMTERDLRTAILSQMAYQSLGRGILRQRGSSGIFLLLVPDHDTAEDIARYYPGCQIERLAPPYAVPNHKTGGPSPRYATEQEKATAKKERDKQAQRRVRWKATNVSAMAYFFIPHCADSHILMPPHPSDQSGQIHASLWDSRAVHWRPYEDFEPQYERHLKGNATYGAHAFFDLLRHRFEQNEFSNKYHNDLFSPARFDLNRDMEHGHSLTNAIDVTGVVLDFDHTDVTSRQVREALPFKMCIYSSHSHEPWDVCFRVVIPTRTPMTLDASKAIRMMCVRRFEEYGFGGSAGGGRRHGVDTSKMHAASLFFLPCRRPGGFLETHEGMPLDPDAWIKTCPSDIVDKVMNEPDVVIPAGPAPRHATNGTTPADRAIAHWHAHGTAQGQGRVQFWVLAVKLAEAGCDAIEIGATLSEQAGYAHNPAERRMEIVGLLKDKKVIAALRW